MDNGLISIIIPCYNSEKTLTKCLHSVIHQTYRNIEIIIINDGSTDGTGEILQSFANADQRIQVHHQVNSGVSKARNVGLAVATGDYVCFVDADDWIEPFHTEILHRTLTEDQADISVGRFAFVHPTSVERQSDSGSLTFFNRMEALESLFIDKEIQSHPCAKLFRSALWNNIKFPEDKQAFEDYAIIFRVFEKCLSVVVINKVIYNYTQSDLSLSHNLSAKRALDFFEAVMEMYDSALQYRHQFANWNKIVRKTSRQSLMNLKRYLRQSNMQHPEVVEQMQRQMAEFLSREKDYIPFSLKWKIMFFVWRPKGYVKFLKFKK